MTARSSERVVSPDVGYVWLGREALENSIIEGVDRKY